MDTAVRTTTKQLTEGQAITYTTGRITITLQCARVDAAYTVTTYQGTLRLADWCASYPTEAEARTAARHTAHAFRAHRTPQAIEARRTELAETVREQTARRSRRMDDRAALIAAEAEYDTLLTLADLAALARLRTSLTADPMEATMQTHTDDAAERGRQGWRAEVAQHGGDVFATLYAAMGTTPARDEPADLPVAPAAHSVGAVVRHRCGWEGIALHTDGDMTKVRWHSGPLDGDDKWVSTSSLQVVPDYAT